MCRYTAGAWLSTNNDSLLNPRWLTKAVNPLTALLFSQKSLQPASTSSRGGASFASVGGRFSADLSALVDKLTACERNFVRCMKPNVEKRPRYFDVRYVQSRVRAAGSLAALRFTKRLQGVVDVQLTTLQRLKDHAKELPSALQKVLSEADPTMFAKELLRSLGLLESNYRLTDTSVTIASAVCPFLAGMQSEGRGPFDAEAAKAIGKRIAAVAANEGLEPESPHRRQVRLLLIAADCFLLLLIESEPGSPHRRQEERKAVIAAAKTLGGGGDGGGGGPSPPKMQQQVSKSLSSAAATAAATAKPTPKFEAVQPATPSPPKPAAPPPGAPPPPNGNGGASKPSNPFNDSKPSNPFNDPAPAPAAEAAPRKRLSVAVGAPPASPNADSEDEEGDKEDDFNAEVLQRASAAAVRVSRASMDMSANGGGRTAGIPSAFARLPLAAPDEADEPAAPRKRRSIAEEPETGPRASVPSAGVGEHVYKHPASEGGAIIPLLEARRAALLVRPSPPAGDLANPTARRKTAPPVGGFHAAPPPSAGAAGPHLWVALAAPEAAARVAAIKGLGAAPPDVASGLALCRALSDRSVDVRLAALEAAAALKYSSLLSLGLEDNEGKVQRQAGHCLPSDAQAGGELCSPPFAQQLPSVYYSSMISS